MAEVRSQVSPFLVLANAYSKYCVWRTPGNNFRLPPRADIVVVPHTPTARVASVVYRAASVLSSPQRIARFQRMTEIFSLLDQMDTKETHPLLDAKTNIDSRLTITIRIFLVFYTVPPLP